MQWRQEIITLRERSRGVHLVTSEVMECLGDLATFDVGMLHLFIQHTSASLALNENASPDVRRDMERWFESAVPDGWEPFEHRLEGDDDMPAHVKAILVGSSVTIPLRRGRLALGTWQGVYLLEHRENGGPRRLVATAWGGAGAPDAHTR
jgi:secondary thiamine-phosphate synthase enzyme